MSWARIMAPLSGGQGDQATVAAAVMLAQPFKAEMVGVYTPADVADVMPWMGEGFLGGVQTTALESLKEAAQVGERHARAAMDKTTYAKSRFIALQTPVWAGLSAESRLSDVVVFTNDPARGRGRDRFPDRLRSCRDLGHPDRTDHDALLRHRFPDRTERFYRGHHRWIGELSAHRDRRPAGRLRRSLLLVLCQ